MNKRSNIVIGLAALMLLGYTLWTTFRVVALEARLEKLEASYLRLGSYTHDLGTAFSRGVAGSELAKVALAQMERDDLTGPCVMSKTRAVLIQSPHSLRNSVAKVMP